MLLGEPYFSWEMCCEGSCVGSVDMCCEGSCVGSVDMCCWGLYC